MRTRAAAELEDVAKAARGDQADARDLAIEQRVRRRRRAMHDGAQRREVGTDLRQRGEHPEGLVLHSRRHLGYADVATLLVKQDEVGEGAADIDADDRHAPRYANWTSSRLVSSSIGPA